MGRAVIYARISNDREGLAYGVERQVSDCAELAGRLGHEVIAIHKDNDISASRASRKTRPGYTAMLEDLESRRADVLIAYSTSRITRRPRDLESLIDIVNDTNAEVIVVVGGALNLNDHAGRAVSRVFAAMDASEAEATAERVRRAALQRREQGRPHGGNAPTGYRYDKKDGLVVDPGPAAVVLSAFEFVAGGGSTTGAARLLREGGIERTPANTSRLLRLPSVAGLMLVEGELRDAEWPGIVPRALWDQVQDRLRYNKPISASRERVHLLPGLARCGVCHRGLISKSGQAPRKCSLTCQSARGGCGQVSIHCEVLDTYVRDWLLDFWDSGSIPAMRGMDERKIEAARQDIVGVDAALRRAQDLRIDGDLTKAEFQEQRARLSTRRREAEQRLAHLVSEGDPAAAIEVIREWAEGVEERRAAIEVLLSAIYVAPGKKMEPPYGRVVFELRSKAPSDNWELVDGVLVRDE